MYRRSLELMLPVILLSGCHWVSDIPFNNHDGQIVRMKMQKGAEATPDGVRRLGYAPQQWLYPSNEPRETLLQEPIYKSTKPIYLTAQYGDGEDTTFTLVLDESGGTESGYDRVYVDVNNDNRLDESEEGFPFRLGTSNRITPLRIEIMISAGDRRVPYTFDFRAFRYIHDGYLDHEIHGQAANPSYYLSEADFDGKQRLIALADLNSNGLFNEPPKAGRYTGDRQYIDLNGDGLFDTFMISSREAQDEDFPYGQPLCVDGKWYTLTASADGSYVQVASAESLIGTIEAKEPFAHITLRSDHQLLAVDLSDGPVRMLSGRYRIEGMVLEAKDGSGDTWRMEGNPGGELTVRSGRTTRLDYGPPIRTTVEPAPTQDPGIVELSLSISGAKGEGYGCPTKKGGKLVAGFEVRDTTGQVVFNKEFGFT